MLAQNRYRDRQRRGIVLILVLGMLGLLALIGVTFAAYSGQAQVGARYVSQSLAFPDADNVFDFALEQLINDTNNPSSAIRYHSLKRDMYGSDAYNNGYYAALPPPVGLAMQVVSVTQPDSTNAPNVYQITTNIPGDGITIPSLYGKWFYGWSLRMELWATDNNGNPLYQVTPPVPQTFQIVNYNYTVGGQTYQFQGDFLNNNNYHVFTLSPADPGLTAGVPGTPGLVNPAWVSNGNLPSNTGLFFVLDNRYRRAFNGPGVGSNFIPLAGLTGTPINYNLGQFANYRWNGKLQAWNAWSGSSPPLGPPPDYCDLNYSYFSTLFPIPELDEDFDAPDLDNWFLAHQSADGNVVIPSFHRPSILQYQLDSQGNVVLDDWQDIDQLTPNNASNPAETVVMLQRMRSKFLRPRKIDHPASGSSFPDLRPDPVTGKITYDVDNDGDGVTDSVWVDLGYPVQRDANGRMFKPLFAFMVLGLNGRLPLNTVGNIQGLYERTWDPNPPYNDTSSNVYMAHQPSFDHASNHGYSVNEINPKFALQNAPIYGALGMIDNAGISVDTTQLRNLLAGTRPQPNPQQAPNGSVNGDSNFVSIDAVNSPPQVFYYMPNGVYDVPPNGSLYTGDLSATRNVAPVPGRWGEPQGVPINTSLWNGTTVQNIYNNPVRAGKSTVLYNSNSQYFPQIDGTDDDYDSLDFYPNGNNLVPESGNLTGVYPSETLLPVERIRRFTTPIDPIGVGKVFSWDVDLSLLYPPGDSMTPPRPATYGRGADRRGRVGFFHYFRPPGLTPRTANQASGAPDVTTNPTHGFESMRLPASTQTLLPPAGPPYPYADPGTGGALAPYASPINPYMGAMPFDQGNGLTAPSFDGFVNSPPAANANNTYNTYWQGSLNRDEADELNVYAPTRYDMPFGPEDLEWLYRKNDTDGAGLVSRLSDLAPISFNNPAPGDALMRRRMFSVDTFDTINFATGNFFVSSGIAPPTLNVTNAPLSLTARDRRINLNFPLPSQTGRPSEPARIKWITESYYALKNVLNITTAQRAASLSQFLVNIIDFRDTDGVITKFTNPDVVLAAPYKDATTGNINPPQVFFPNDPKAAGLTTTPLVQYGMEYNPIALNEILAYEFISGTKGNAATDGPYVSTQRLFIELVNTLTDAAFADGSGNTASDLDLQNWQVAIAPDTPYGRPDPINGQIPPVATGGTPIATYQITSGGTPLISPALKTNGGPSYFVLSNPAPAGVDSTPVTGANAVLPTSLMAQFTPYNAGANKGSKGAAAYYWLYLLRPADPTLPVSPTNPAVVVDSTRFPYTEAGYQVTYNSQTKQYSIDQMKVPTTPRVIYSIERHQPYRGGHAVPSAMAFDPTTNSTLTTNGFTPATAYGYSEQTQPAANTASTLNGQFILPTGTSFTPSPAVTLTIQQSLGARNGQSNKFSSYLALDTAGRGNPTPNNNTTNNADNYIDPAWDFFPFFDRDFSSIAELLLVPECGPGLFTKQFVEEPPSVAAVRDRRSPIPQNTPPAPADATTLFTGNPPQPNPTPSPSPFYPAGTTNNFSNPSNNPVPVLYPFVTPPFETNSTYAKPSVVVPNNDYIGQPFLTYDKTQVPPAPPPPHAYPYLADQFFYSGPNDSWYKMLEFFEVPSSANGTIGPIAGGSDYDWRRQDTKPGLINLNLIIDEEVFFGILDDPRLNRSFVGADSYPLPPHTTVGALNVPSVVTLSDASGAPAVSGSPPLGPYPGSYPLNNRGFFDPPTTTFAMKAAFSDFLKLRHGGSNFLYAYGLGPWFTSASAGFPVTPGTGTAMTGPPSLERPFRSLSFTAFNAGVSAPGVEMTVMRPATINPSAGLRTTTKNASNAQMSWNLPDIPPRRLFEVPDFEVTVNATTEPSIYPDGVSGNKAIDTYLRDSNNGVTPLILPHPTLANPGADLYWTGDPVTTEPFFLGANGNANVNATGGIADADLRQHPYYRTEMLQKVMNLTTTRTHQYAVWITVGFFEVIQPASPQLASQPFAPNLQPQAGVPDPLMDQLGRELGVMGGRNVRYRGFFVVDRSKATGFDPGEPGDFHELVTFEKRIE